MNAVLKQHRGLHIVLAVVATHLIGMEVYYLSRGMHVEVIR